MMFMYSMCIVRLITNQIVLWYYVIYLTLWLKCLVNCEMCPCSVSQTEAVTSIVCKTRC